ncbi:MAG: flavodoxin family protein [Deltaproteobacteria bacterium]|jgi:flavodoxin|nr:flavodoxin family protein [Deltaproteobacteria bacterium]
MKTLVVYSSLTGNTEKVALAVAETIYGAEAFPIEKAPDPSEYSLIIIGFWVDRGQADRKTQDYIERVKDKPVAFFFTLGAFPDSEHAGEVARVTADLLSQGNNEILGSFRSQGKVDPALIKRMKESLPPGHPHATMSEERKARLAEAAKHPNEEDLMKAKAFAADTYQKALAGPPKAPIGRGR